MCKERIEGSLKSDGIDKAGWDIESKMITISCDPAKISLYQIQKNIVDTGLEPM